MQFTNNQVTELIIPAGTPFAPGFDVIGIGADAPPELLAEGFSVGMIIYNSQWNPNLNTPQVKYMFLGSKVETGVGGLFFIGFAVAPNAAANPNNVVLNNGWQMEALNASSPSASGMRTQVAAFNGNGNPIGAMFDNASANGIVVSLTDGGSVSGQLGP